MEGLYSAMSSAQFPCLTNTMTTTNLRRPAAMDICDNFISSPGGTDCAVAAFQHLEPPSLPLLVNPRFSSSYQLIHSSSPRSCDPQGCSVFPPFSVICHHGHGLTQCSSCLTFEGQAARRVGFTSQTSAEISAENPQFPLMSFSPHPLLFPNSISSHWHGFLPSFEETVSASGSPETASRTEITSREPAAESKPIPNGILSYHQSISPTSSTEMSAHQTIRSVAKSCSSGSSSFGTDELHPDNISTFVVKAESDEHDSRGLLSSEDMDFRDEHVSDLLWESYLQNVQQPLSVCLEPQPLPENYASNAFSRELEEFDNFIASIKEMHEKQDGSNNAKKAESQPSQKLGFVSFWDPLDAQDSLGSTVTEESKMARTNSARPRNEMKGLLYEMADVAKMNQVKYPPPPSIDQSLGTKSLHQAAAPTTMTLPASVESVKVGKKRSRNGEHVRPRPKDRQRIQDCILELRGIIPSSKKCSIDALLEKTIKHINFLQTMKVKWNESDELQGHEDTKPSTTTESGTSWAVEVDEQGKRCPIIVENLNQPGQLLVEMLCEKKDLVLEITECIRGMGFTILKGVMETKQDKLWAKFVVEANQEVHRVQVLWSLMELLESTNTKASSDVSNPS